jgi:hypothetical protein
VITPARPGTGNAVDARVRVVVLLLMCTACGGSVRPAVTPKLSELPWDSTTGSENRDAVLATSHAEPGPEQKPKSKRAQKIETAAATAAAWVGLIFSKTSNVTLGGGMTFDENRLVHPEPAQKKAKKKVEPVKSDGPLVPWVRLDNANEGEATAPTNKQGSGAPSEKP